MVDSGEFYPSQPGNKEQNQTFNVEHTLVGMLNDHFNMLKFQEASVHEANMIDRQRYRTTMMNYQTDRRNKANTLIEYFIANPTNSDVKEILVLRDTVLHPNLPHTTNEQAHPDVLEQLKEKKHQLQLFPQDRKLANEVDQLVDQFADELVIGINDLGTDVNPAYPDKVLSYINKLISKKAENKAA